MTEKYRIIRRVTDWRKLIINVLSYCFVFILMNYFVLVYLFGGEPKNVILLYMQIGLLNAVIIGIIISILLIYPEDIIGNCTKVIKEEVRLEKVKRK